MKITIGTLLTIITLIGSLLIGGIHFGGLLADTTYNTVRIQEQENKLIVVTENIRIYQENTAESIAMIERQVAVLIEIMKRVEKILYR